MLPVTAVIPAYQAAELLPRALRSVDAQRPCGVSETIVVDDCSSDATGEVARAHGARVVRHDENRGLAAARNSGIAAASTPWVALLDADDEWHADHLAALWELRDGHVLVAGTAVWRDEAGLARRLSGPLTRGPHRIDSPAEIVFPDHYLTPSSLLLDVGAVRAAGWYDESLRELEDLDLHLRLLERGAAVATPRVVTTYRVHSGQMTQDRALMRERQRMVLRRYAGRPWWSPALLERVGAVAAWDELRERLAERDARGVASAAAHIVRRPVRVAALGRLWARRLRLRRGARSLVRDR